MATSNGRRTTGDPRILLFTGKGGVGKTTLAAATALRASEQGLRTLVLSSDPAHSLADALDRDLGPEPGEIQPGLDAMELDLYYSMKKHWSNLRLMLLQTFKWQGVDRVAAEELAALPGMEEASALLWLDDLYHDGNYDLIIVDSAPTGETLTFLTLPQTVQWWLERGLPFQRTAILTGGAMVRTFTGIPLDKGYKELERVFEKLQRVKDVLSDPARSSVRLVANPERMVIREAQRAYTYLQVYGYPVDAVLVNRILPEEAAEGVFSAYVAAQADYLQEIEESFAPLPILKVPHLGQEVFGLEGLVRIGQDLYGDRDPAQSLYEEPTYVLDQDRNAYVLSIRTPFLEREDVEVRHYGDALVIQAQARRRNFFLPKFLALYQIQDTAVEDGWLRIRFAEPA